MQCVISVRRGNMKCKYPLTNLATRMEYFRSAKSIPWLLALPGQQPWYWQRRKTHDDVIKWKHFPRYWPFARGIHRSPVNSPHKGQWRGALVFSLICVWIIGWVNNREAGYLRRYRVHYDVIIMGSLSILIKEPFLYAPSQCWWISENTSISVTNLSVYMSRWSVSSWYR